MCLFKLRREAFPFSAASAARVIIIIIFVFHSEKSHLLTNSTEFDIFLELEMYVAGIEITPNVIWLQIWRLRRAPEMHVYNECTYAVRAL